MDIALSMKKIASVFKKQGLRKLLHRFEVNRAVFFGILTQIWSLIAGPVTALLVILKFNPEYQGYYYTFGSLLALQIFVILGFGTVIIQFASHEWSKLKIDNYGGITGDKEAFSRLVSLANITSKWFLVGGAIIALCLGLAGYLFFIKSSVNYVNWALPWFFLCFFTGITVCLIPVWSILEGCNQVATLYTYRLFQGIVASLSIWIAIFSGAKLWSASISVVATLLCAILFIKYKYWNFVKVLFFTKPSSSCIDWTKEIFPMQWRIATSWICGYFISSFFTPVIFHYHGPVVAGQFGMTWSLLYVISAIAGSWLSPNAPKFGILIAKKRYAELDVLFFRLTKIFMFITILSAVMIWVAVYLLNKLNHPFATRMLPVFPTTLFLIAQLIVMLSTPFSVYMRAHKKEPLLFVSIAVGVSTALVTFVLGKYSVIAIGFGYLTINVVLVPFIFLIWYRCRIIWHSEPGI